MDNLPGARWMTHLAWITLLIFIPLVSAVGRPLLNWLRDHFPTGALALSLFTVSLLGAISLLLWTRRQGGGFGKMIMLFGWIVPCFLLLPLTFPVVEERVHFLLFGGLGFFSMLLFSFPVAMVVTLSYAGLDELWQWVLPDRFGDWRDVGINAIAGVGGIVTAWIGKKR